MTKIRARLLVESQLPAYRVSVFERRDRCYVIAKLGENRLIGVGSDWNEALGSMQRDRDLRRLLPLPAAHEWKFRELARKFFKCLIPSCLSTFPKSSLPTCSRKAS